MELSSRVEYALLALLELASRQQRELPLTVNEIAGSQAIPERYLDQILTHLRRSGILISQRGAKGGYLLAKEPWQITLLEVVISVEGNNSAKEGEILNSQTIEKTVVLEIWQQAKVATQSILASYTLQDLCQHRDNYLQQNPMYYI
ncbi:MAG TPA: Rrf2 family transcriptional regulator [Kamptonema sp.]|nr:Rrf2 family transcriptional regulator [Kamptonema sp.]